MLRGFGAELTVDVDADGTRHIAIHGEAELKPQTLVVPGDPSSAAFPIVAALITPGSDVTVTNVGMNPTRTGLFRMLQAMGADLTIANEREVGGEPRRRSDRATQRSLGDRSAARHCAEHDRRIPAFFVAASFAQGRTTTSGLDELRVKESDRLALMAKGLARIGAHVEEREDGLAIEGTGGDALGGGNDAPIIHAELDHRIAMSFAVAGQATKGGLVIDDMSPVATSFPRLRRSHPHAQRPDMTFDLANIVGLLGSAMMIVAYAYSNLATTINFLAFNLLNLVGALLLISSLAVHFNMASMTLEIVWAAIALFGLVQVFRRKAR